MENKESYPFSASARNLTKGKKSTSKTNAFGGIAVVRQIQGSQVAKKPSYNHANIARNILLAAGRHPTLPPLNSAFSVLKQTLPNIFDAPVDLATVRWEILDPPCPPAVGAEADDKGVMGAPAVPRLASLGPGEIAAATPPPTPQMGWANGRKKQTESFPATPTGQTSQTFSQPFYLPLSRVLSHSGPTYRMPPSKKEMKKAAPPGRPTKPVINPAVVPSKKATRATPVQEKETGKRKSRSSVATTTKARKERQRSSSTSSSDGPSGYKVYPCKWSACPAELHNYETLVRHVMYKHKKDAEGGDFNCHWHGCTMGSLADSVAGKPMQQISDVKEWEQHVMTHMEEVKEVLGLGPRLSETGELPPCYLQQSLF